jgi:hypothetical protein
MAVSNRDPAGEFKRVGARLWRAVERGFDAAKSAP